MNIETVAVCVSAERPDQYVIDQAAELLRRGELVAFPTETVYGLGGNALDAAAAAGIFRAKGRPSGNPLIVHVSSSDDARPLVTEWPKAAVALTDRFWPGPLTLVLQKTPVVPDIVTGGGSTVAIRSPAHPVARALLLATGFPLAAPSANLSEQLSPTTAQHVLSGLGGRIAMILDAGPTQQGIESTVLALTGPVPVLLRPGPISPADIEAVIGPVSRSPAHAMNETSALPSPGMMARHYAPQARLVTTKYPIDAAAKLLAEGARVGILLLRAQDDVDGMRSQECNAVIMPEGPALYAAELYARLHELDAFGVSEIVVEEPPATEEWLAIRDRLRRAASD